MEDTSCCPFCSHLQCNPRSLRPSMRRLRCSGKVGTPAMSNKYPFLHERRGQLAVPHSLCLFQKIPRGGKPGRRCVVQPRLLCQKSVLVIACIHIDIRFRARFSHSVLITRALSLREGGVVRDSTADSIRGVVGLSDWLAVSRDARTNATLHALATAWVQHLQSSTRGPALQ